ncbi:MAG: acetylornithine transaminase [Acidimicrobiales bacterium]
MTDPGLNGFLMDNYAAPPVTFVRGQGAYLYDQDDKRYLDFLSGIAVTSLGHCHPAVVEAVRAQAGRLWHVSNLFGNDVANDVAATLDRLISARGGRDQQFGNRPSASVSGKETGEGPGEGKVFFANSGAEANECAIKLARRWAGPGRHVVVSAYGSFHGRTLATLHATGQPHKHEAFQPLPEGFRHVAWNDVGALVSSLDASVVAAVMLEPILGEGGVVMSDPGYLAEVQAACRERGILLIMDEIQTGLGRTGAWFGFQHDEIRPDIVTMAKALGNGMPIGACWARNEVADAFRPGDHGSTFGGQPLAAAAARATLSVMEAEDVPDRAVRAGRHLAQGLAALPGIADVRGRGLLLGAVLDDDLALDGAGVVAAALAAGLVINAPAPRVLRLAPSLLISSDEIDQALAILSGLLEVASAGRRQA